MLILINVDDIKFKGKNYIIDIMLCYDKYKKLTIVDTYLIKTMLKYYILKNITTTNKKKGVSLLIFK